MYQSLFNTVHYYGINYLALKCLEKIGFLKQKNSVFCVEKYYLRLPPQKREDELKKYFLKRVGYPLDLDHPKTFDEKLQWLKLYDSTPLKTKLADKYAVREWVKNKIGGQYLVPLYGAWNSFEEIDFSELPEKFVLKATHGSETNIIVKNKNDFNKEEARRKFDYWMKLHFGIGPQQEWHYLNIPHRIIAEMFLETPSGELPDYKVYCFDGTPVYIQLIEGRSGDTKHCFFDLDWNVMPFSYNHYEKLDNIPNKPQKIDDMIKLTKILAEGFPFVRIDWYLINDHLYFGEMTFTPGKGIQHWIPSSADKELGDLITLPTKKYILQTS